MEKSFSSNENDSPYTIEIYWFPVETPVSEIKPDRARACGYARVIDFELKEFTGIKTTKAYIVSSRSTGKLNLIVKETATLEIVINFGFDSSTLDACAWGGVIDWAKKTNLNDASVIIVEGYTDCLGTPEYNLQLSKKRAETISRYLSNYFQINNDRFKIIAHGEEHASKRSCAADRKVIIRKMKENVV